MIRFSDQFPVDLRTSVLSLSIWVFLCVTQFLLWGRNRNDNSIIQMTSIRMISLFSPIESGFRNRGEVSTITAIITANYGNDSLFLCCLPFQWKWFWMLLSNQILRQVPWLSHPFSRWVFDPGINMEDPKYWIRIGQTKELWAYPFMERKNYEINTIPDTVFDGSIHGLALEVYGQTVVTHHHWTPHIKCHEENEIMIVRFWTSKLWAFGEAPPNSEVHSRSKSTPSRFVIVSMSLQEAFNKCKDVRSQSSINMKFTLFLRMRIRTNWYRVNISKHVTDTMAFSGTIWKTQKAMPIWHTHRIKVRQIGENEDNNIQWLLACKTYFERKQRSILFFSNVLSSMYGAYFCLCNNL